MNRFTQIFSLAALFSAVACESLVGIQDGVLRPADPEVETDGAVIPTGGTNSGGASGNPSTNDAGLAGKAGMANGGSGGQGGMGGQGGTAGTGATAGTSGGGTGGVSQDGGTAPSSCQGLPNQCGFSGTDDCCSALAISGGTYNRSQDLDSPATVSDFHLDKYEITVGRFRRFFEAYPQSKPSVGDGAHPAIENSGWQASWDSELAANQSGLDTALRCETDLYTWTTTAGGNELKPINCLSWYDAFAFCAWDGGRLVTEAEWNYAAAGGSQQREYPWSNPPSSTVINSSWAAYDCTGDGLPNCSLDDILAVGSKSSGAGRWGHLDLSGNVWEWTLDYYEPGYESTKNCKDCAQIQAGSSRAYRGGGFGSAAITLRTRERRHYLPTLRFQSLGARCAR